MPEVEVTKSIEEEAFEAWEREAREHVGTTMPWADVPDGLQRAWTAALDRAHELLAKQSPVPMLLWCPECGVRHVDEGEFAKRVHHTHACQTCGHCWRPAVVPTVGVQFLPGFRDKEVAGG